jgi:hypothetical protein
MGMKVWVAATLRRQTQELLDAITNGKPDVWDRYLDSAASYTTEDGTIRSKREMVGDIHGHALHCQYRTTDTWLKTPAGWRLIGAQVLALRTDPPAVALAPAAADELVGKYILSPELSYEIRREGGVLLGQVVDFAERREAWDLVWAKAR